MALVALVALPVEPAYALAPTITSFSPTQGPVGTAVVLSGTDFAASTSVTFNGVEAIFTIDSDTQISTTVPAGATTGPIAVANPDGTGTSAEDFTMIVPPQISGFTPTQGTFNSLVTITGTGFTGVFSVRFNGRNASFNVVSDTEIRARVPSGAGTGPIRVENAAGADLSSTNFLFKRIRHNVTVTMQLDGHLRAIGEIKVGSRSPRIRRLCGARRIVRIQRYASGRFRGVARGRSQRDRDYRIGLPDRQGRYRAVVGVKKTPNRICLADTSRVRTHEHASGGGGGGGGGGNCHSSYPTVCIPPPPPDLDCGDIPFTNFAVVGSDPHGFDGDNDGVGCET